MAIANYEPKPRHQHVILSKSAEEKRDAASLAAGRINRALGCVALKGEEQRELRIAENVRRAKIEIIDCIAHNPELKKVGNLQERVEDALHKAKQIEDAAWWVARTKARGEEIINELAPKKGYARKTSKRTRKNAHGRQGARPKIIRGLEAGE